MMGVSVSLGEDGCEGGLCVVWWWGGVAVMGSLYL